MNTCRCGSSWTGLSPAHCSECHLTFSTITAFDRHRRNFACLEPAEAGLVCREDVWGQAGNRPGLLMGRESEGLTAPGESTASPDAA